MNAGYVDESVPGCEGMGNTTQPIPRLCTYQITIKEISCGLEHSAFITWDNYLYTIGSNKSGQLGINDRTVESKNSPTLVDYFYNNKEDPHIWVGMATVTCGHYHTIVVSAAGEVWAWGEAAYGALGVPITSTLGSNVFVPTAVRIKV